jgi:hypothetical protein
MWQVTKVAKKEEDIFPKDLFFFTLEEMLLL